MGNARQLMGGLLRVQGLLHRTKQFAVLKRLGKERNGLDSEPTRGNQQIAAAADQNERKPRSILCKLSAEIDSAHAG
jgi:hypothetical protein